MSNIHIETIPDCVKNTTIGCLDSQNLDQKKIVKCPVSLNNVSELSDVSEGLDFMLWHFPGPLWPRNISTVATRNAQKTVDDRDRAILYFKAALRVDCKLAIYPNYGRMGESDPNTPTSEKPRPIHLFIDLDLASFGGDVDKLDVALQVTRRNIKRHLNGATPTILWSGGGYHIHQPLDPEVMPVYEDLTEFKRYKDPSVQFMRYAEQALTNGKADKNHRISFGSCMARIPGSENSKYEGDDIANVKIIQPWDGIRARPTQQFMLTDFLIYLTQADIDFRERMKSFHASGLNFPQGQGIAWIDRLLETPIADWRRTAVAMIIAPYLLTIKRMSYEQAYNAIIQWGASCAQLSSLRPNERGFVSYVHASLNRARVKQSRPLRWNTLVNNYTQLYELIVTGKRGG